MRLTLAALVSSLLMGCATKPAKAPAEPERSTASAASSITLNIRANEIKEAAILDNTASTACRATQKDYLNPRIVYFTCATTTRVGIHVVSPYLNVDQVYGGIQDYVITGYASQNALETPSSDAAAAKELVDVQANNLNAIGRRYRKLADGCMGDSVALSYGADKIDLQTGEYFGDLRCRIKRKNAKVAAGTVYYFEVARAEIGSKLTASAWALKYGGQVFVEADKQNSDTIGWLTTQGIERGTNAAQATAGTVTKAATLAQSQMKEAAEKSAATLNKMTAPMRDYISATIATLAQVQERSRQAGADLLRDASDKIRP